jgi:cellulose synthase/poly-beta-1,6-N-acetylglucosamine synthase-like glycosyltransferase/GGDEF domain-containing protein
MEQFGHTAISTVPAVHRTRPPADWHTRPAFLPPRPSRRPPVPPGLVSRRDWLAQARRALRLRARSACHPVVAVLRTADRDSLASRLRYGELVHLHADLAAAVADEMGDRALVAVSGGDCVLVLLRGMSPARAGQALEGLLTRLGRRTFTVGGEPLLIHPSCGWVSAADLRGVSDPHMLLECATVATELAEGHLDLVPRRWVDDGASRPRGGALRARLRHTSVQIGLTVVVGVAAPYAALTALYLLGVDLAEPVYLAVMFALVLTAAVVWVEGLYALDPVQPPAEPAAPYPPACAVIAAYLPNEAATIVDTVRAFLAQRYPAALRVVLAYNTPRPLAVEDELRAIAAADRRLILLNVKGSTSKAQNVNVALRVVSGAFVGVFDADHHPAPDAFRRAWHWLSHGADMVQGHCVIRNGDAAPVARTVAVEFESIYAVSHPGRAGLHGFALFGGSNGFWRTEALHAVRMRGWMLTEDIDSSIRALLAGFRMVYDRTLLSRELAPQTLRALWHQRLRWAQGWFQVSRRHLWNGLHSPELSLRQKLGLAFLLGWREIYPWLSLQMYPVMAFLVWRAGGPSKLDWLIPTFVLTSVYTLSVGPGQALLAWWTAVPELRGRRRWFLRYLLWAPLYAEWKNQVARVAQVRELLGQRAWVVTPRQAERRAAA